MVTRGGLQERKREIAGSVLQESVIGLGLVTAGDWQAARESLPASDSEPAAVEIVNALVGKDKLTAYQGRLLLAGRGNELVLGNYVILDQIGEGGMGQVFRARHRRMKRDVAIKMLPRDRLRLKSDVERFHREVELVARLDHTNIVTAYDADECNGQHFLVMQYVDGADLASVVGTNGPLNAGQAVAVLLQAASGLEYAHSKGIVHRDLKPGNLLVDRTGVVKVLDLGLARTTNEPDDAAALTRDGSTLGTVEFMAPEQAVDTRSADARSDVYSLGCTLFFLLTGKMPYTGHTPMAKMLAHREQPIPDLRAIRGDLPEWLVRVFQKMVAKKPGDRPQTMRALLDELRPHEELAEPLILEVGWLAPKVVHDAATMREEPQEMQETTVGVPSAPADSLATFLAAVGKKNKTRARRGRLLTLRQRVVLGTIAAGVLGLVAVLLGVVLRVSTPEGTLVVEVSDPTAVLTVDGKAAKVEVQTDAGKSSFHVGVDPGTHTLLVTTKDGVSIPLDKDVVTISAGKETKVVARLERKAMKAAETAPIASITASATASPAAAKSRDREAAEWVLSLGARVEISQAGKRVKVDTEKSLPEGQIELVGVEGIPDETLKGEDVSRFSGLQSLQTLDLNYQLIPAAALAMLQDLPKLTSLRLQSPRVTNEKRLPNDEGVRSLVRFPKLGEIQVVGDVSPELIAEIVDSHPLLELFVFFPSRAKCEAKHVQCLHQLRLKQLGLRQITDEALASISGLSTVQRLDVLSQYITDEGVSQLTDLSSLKWLYLNGDKLSEASLDSIVANCPNLTIFAFRGKPGVPVDWAKLAGLSRLNDLSFETTGYGDEAIEGLMKLKQLKVLKLGQSQHWPGVNKFTREGVERLHAALPNCKIISDFGTFGPGSGVFAPVKMPGPVTMPAAPAIPPPVKIPPAPKLSNSKVGN